MSFAVHGARVNEQAAAQAALLGRMARTVRTLLADARI
jgi:hypothetical protein